ncbi:unnamed protein product [Heterobilharzia americana]|nr:unnamed protein product [Heterobilharzia americana]
MVYDSSFLLTVKDRVTEKLKTLGAFIDDELPDYIMVMVANKKSESGMAKDLQLFLGEHTKKFTEWLHLTLENLKGSGRDSNESRKDSEGVRRSRSKSGKRKIARLHSPESHNDRSRSRSPLELIKHGKRANSSREPHGEADVVGIKVPADTQAPVDSEGYHVKERKVMSTSSLSKKISQENDRVSSDIHDEINLKSVVEVRNSESHKRTRTKSEYPQPSNLLLKRAMNEAKASTMASESHFQTQPKRKPIARPVACSDVSSSSQPDSTRFFITLSGAEANPIQLTTSSNLRNSSRVDHLRSVGYSDETVVLNDTRLRLGSRLVNSTSLRGDGRISAKHRLGPVIQSNARIVSVSRSDDNFNYSSGNEFDDLVEGDYVEIACDDAYVDDVVDEDLPLKGNCGSRSKLSLGDKLSQQIPQLVVNLNETDEEEDVATLRTETERQKRKISTKSKEKTQNATDSVKESGTQQNIPSSLERCKFWPSCRNGTSCPYIHPSEPCQLFPRCKFGATCTFIHPPCRYGALCTRADCPFTHSSKRLLRKCIFSVVRVLLVSISMYVTSVSKKNHPVAISRMLISRS